jgi:hypothetical protein
MQGLLSCYYPVPRDLDAFDFAHTMVNEAQLRGAPSSLRPTTWSSSAVLAPARPT